MKRKYITKPIMSLTQIPMMNPDIVTGISLMLLFVAVGTIIGTEEKLSFVTILISHITFCLPFVFLAVMPRIRQLDKFIPEAALDLGATPLQSFFKVELPNIMPGVASGFVMAFTLSLDDFVISYFTSGNEFQTLPLLIYSMTKKEVKPDIYALSALMIFTVLILLIVSNLAGDREIKKSPHAKKQHHHFKEVD